FTTTHLINRRHTRSTLFPYTTLFRSSEYDQALYYRVSSIREETNGNLREALRAAEEAWKRIQGVPEYAILAPSILAQLAVLHGRDRKSTRLNSSHVKISYAVFCLNKK